MQARFRTNSVDGEATLSQQRAGVDIASTESTESLCRVDRVTDAHHIVMQAFGDILVVERRSTLVRRFLLQIGSCLEMSLETKLRALLAEVQQENKTTVAMLVTDYLANVLPRQRSAGRTHELVSGEF